MKKKCKAFVMALFIVAGLARTGCQPAQRVPRDTAEAPVTPTAQPLSPATPTVPKPTEQATDAAKATASRVASPTPKPPNNEAPNTIQPPASLEIPTRVIPPQEAIDLPPGFDISVFSQGLRAPRMMTLGPGGELYVAERSADRIIRLADRDEDGVADGIESVAEGLRAPSSLAFYGDGSLYVGETTRVLRLWDPDGDGVFQEQEVIIDGLPDDGHSTRTVLFSPGGDYLYVAIGSSCNVCIEDDARRATIMRYKPDGSDEMIYARGLRNAVGITFRPGTEELWATNNGRDWLGDDQPPETIYRVQEGDDAGWPRCHAGHIVDPDFGESGACEDVAQPAIEMQAHSAPLGLTFYTGQQFPEAYRGGLFIAFHGSWNRSEPTGYKVVYVPIENGKPGATQDFATGWLHVDGSHWGRPVDVLTGPNGSLFVSDDGEGRIYRIFYTGEGIQ